MAWITRVELMTKTVLTDDIPGDLAGEVAGDIDLGENPLALERQVCFALAVASRSVIGIYRPLLEPMGLTHPQYLVMLALWDAFQANNIKIPYPHREIQFTRDEDEKEGKAA